MIELNKIYNEDCLEGMQRIESGSIDMILCDLPYGTTACKWDVVIPFEPLWEQYKRIIKPNGAIVLTASQPFTTKLIMSNFGWFKYEWIWEKSKGLGFQHSSNMPLKRHENILIFSNGAMGHLSLLGNKRMVYNPIGTIITNEKGVIDSKKHGENLGSRSKQIGREYIKKTGFPNSIIKIDSETGLHPTQKPVALFEYLIKTYTNEGDTVLDNCMGSGTTAVACINTNRNFIGFEKDKEYFDKAVNRIENLDKRLFA